jgi:hypothetical protein
MVPLHFPDERGPDQLGPFGGADRPAEPDREVRLGDRPEHPNDTAPMPSGPVTDRGPLGRELRAGGPDGQLAGRGDSQNDPDVSVARSRALAGRRQVI